MAFTDQQQNATTRLLTALSELREVYYDLMRADDGIDLLGIPADGEFPPPGDLNHLTPPVLKRAAGVFESMQTWMTTAVVLAPGQGNKTPLDAIVEALR